MLDAIATPALLALIIAPLVVAVVAAAMGRRAPVFVARLGTATAAAGLLIAIAGLPSATDHLAAALLLLIFGVSAIAQGFAVRYLAGDSRAAWFTCGASLLTSASTVMASATTMIGLAIGWTAVGLVLCLLLGTYRELPAARDGVRRTALAFCIGDGALWAAVGLHHLDADALAPIIAVLIVIAALSRSAQIPFHRWLPATLAAPTPVSALLHAGVVNGGGVLLVKLSGLSSPLAAGIVIAAGTASMAYGAVLMLVKPDIKGALAYSTMAQMGFMMLTCGLGLWAAAVIHLIGHGFYKATLFLSSGTAVARHQRHHALAPPPGLTRPRRWTIATTAALLPLSALAIGAAVMPTWAEGHAAELALLVFAWVTGAAATWGWLRRQPTLAGAVGAAAVLLPAAVTYVAVISAVSRYLAPALPASTVSPATIWAVIAGALAVLGALAALRASPAARGLQRTLYTHAISAGTLHPTGAHR
ncbi:proton-conducting transporter membrane subunit [Mycolicibacterium chlorophenolicum]|uniref:NADH-quinone oxidoreductase subunit 12 n=1 Tax=Mycolicibacterium chlorophenolicum TaxID=37916 RepID=A0A0J6ZBQ8_9MYCO|nr:proton-conducting transporter membrane subunit [Mycolicibacterium chlorophenolicum]KMO82111.1 NADH-quinone oxidoreductase subunit 12 [Mycolicibacterium chlorophenolicum]